MLVVVVSDGTEDKKIDDVISRVGRLVGFWEFINSDVNSIKL